MTLPRYLPQTLLQIAEFCGEELFWKIWGHYAGCRLHVPKKPSDQLVQLLGADGALQFCHCFGGESLSIPKGDAAKRAVRDASIRADDLAGFSENALVKKYGLTYRQIQTITRSNPVKSGNLDIFDFL